MQAEHYSCLCSCRHEWCTEKPREELKARTAEMEQNALKAVIDLVEVSELVNLPEVLLLRSVGFIQLKWHIQEGTEEQAHPEALHPTCKSSRTSLTWA